MRKRPVCMGALFLLALLTLAGFLKPGGVSPLGISGFSGKDTFPGRVKAAGRVKAREPVSGGIRLYLDHFSLKSSHLHSNQISETNSFKNPGIQTGIYSQNDSGSYQMIVYLKEGQTASVGSRILLEGELSLPGRAGNPGQFDAASYYLPRKILLILQDGVIEKQLEEGKNFTGFLAAIREKLQDSYWQVLGEEQAGTISAITLGDRSGLPEEIKTIYQEGGIAHVLAISSLHITLLEGGCTGCCEKQAVFSDVGHLSLALIFSFCQMTGMSVSAQRACLMFGLWVGSQILGGPMTASPPCPWRPFWFCWRRPTTEGRKLSSLLRVRIVAAASGAGFKKAVSSAGEAGGFPVFFRRGYHRNAAGGDVLFLPVYPLLGARQSGGDPLHVPADGIGAAGKPSGLHLHSPGDAGRRPLPLSAGAV